MYRLGSGFGAAFQTLLKNPRSRSLGEGHL